MMSTTLRAVLGFISRAAGRAAATHRASLIEHDVIPASSARGVGSRRLSD
jgi:hypothetical protein